MIRLKRVEGIPARIGGDQHTGWLPPGADRTLPMPIRDVLLDVELQSDGASGCLLCVAAQDASVFADTWHPSPEEAERVAAERYGIRPGDWRAG